MLTIKKKYVTDEHKKPVAVQLDVKTFNRIEELLEDYALGKLLEENMDEEYLTLQEAKEKYTKGK